MEDPDQRIVGVVYQLFAEGILFEFETDNDRVEIGLANPRDITFKGKQMPDEILKSGKMILVICPNVCIYTSKDAVPIDVNSLLSLIYIVIVTTGFKV